MILKSGTLLVIGMTFISNIEQTNCEYQHIHMMCRD
jgi:hypothetical protein